MMGDRMRISFRNCERSEAIQPRTMSRLLDCFVAALLAMTTGQAMAQDAAQPAGDGPALEVDIVGGISAPMPIAVPVMPTPAVVQVAEGLSTGDEATLDLDAGTVSAGVALAGETEPVIGPADVDVADGVLTIVYAWGSAEDGNLDLAVQTIEGLHSSPGGVNTGSAGLAAAWTSE